MVNLKMLSYTMSMVLDGNHFPNERSKKNGISLTISLPQTKKKPKKAGFAQKIGLTWNGWSFYDIAIMKIGIFERYIYRKVYINVLGA